MEKECKYCKEIITYDKPQQLGAHIGNCKDNPNRQYIKEELLEYKFNCKKCDKEYSLNLSENNFNKEKYTKYCSRSCANSRVSTEEKKIKTSNTLKHRNFNNMLKTNKILKTNICCVCNNQYNVINKSKCCSDECTKILKKNASKKGSIIREFNKTILDINKNTYIYALLDICGDIRYIGKSDNPELRLKNHIKESKYKRTHKEKWINSMLQNGVKPELLILDICKYKDWQIFEEMWIGLVKSWNINLTNGTCGGEGSDGFRGKKHTEETKEKLRLANTGRKLTLEHRNKISENNRKRKKTTIL